MMPPLKQLLQRLQPQGQVLLPPWSQNSLSPTFTPGQKLPPSPGRSCFNSSSTMSWCSTPCLAAPELLAATLKSSDELGRNLQWARLQSVPGGGAEHTEPEKPGFKLRLSTACPPRKRCSTESNSRRGGFCSGEYRQSRQNLGGSDSIGIPTTRLAIGPGDKTAAAAPVTVPAVQRALTGKVGHH